MSKQTRFPPGWDDARVKQVIQHYDSQSEDEAVAEDDAAFDASQTVMNVPPELVPEIRRLIARRKKRD